MPHSSVSRKWNTCKLTATKDTTKQACLGPSVFDHAASCVLKYRQVLEHRKTLHGLGFCLGELQIKL